MSHQFHYVYSRVPNKTERLNHAARTIQKYKDGGLSDAKVFTLGEGLTWTDGSGRTHTVTKIEEWRGVRAQAGRIAPRGFASSNKFGRGF